MNPVSSGRPLLAAAVVFMITALTLSWFGGDRTARAIIGDSPAALQPLEESTFPEAPAIPGTQGEAPTGFEEIPAPEPSSEE